MSAISSAAGARIAPDQTITISPAQAAQLQALPPAQQQAAISQLAMQQQATLGAEMTKPPSTIKTVLKNVAIFGGLGAALGFGASFFTLPFIGQVGAPIAAAVGGGIGAVVGLVKGVMSARKQQAEYAQAAAGSPVDPLPTVDPAPPAPAPAAPAGAPSSPGKTGSRTGKHKVAAGDTLASIAKRHGTTWQKLHAANRDVIGANPNVIRPGQQLKLPGAGR